MYRDDRRYSTEHEWVRVEGDVGWVGITEYAQNELGDVVFVELPEVGAAFEAGEELGTIESVKAVSSIYAPLAGLVVEVNAALADKPETVNQDPHGAGWLVKLRLSAPAQLESLLSAGDYQRHIGH